MVNYIIREIWLLPSDPLVLGSGRANGIKRLTLASLVDALSITMRRVGERFVMLRLIRKHTWP